MFVFVILLISLLLIIGGYKVYSYANEQIQRMKIEEKLDDYHRSSYYVFTRKSYSEMMKDKGTNGEYAVFSKLRPYEQFGGRLLFNLYFPKADNTTAEIDMLLITTKGIFVIESKNYNGIISGGYEDFWWNQKLGNNISYKFYNPVMQNESHIKILKDYVPENLPIYSVVVFSDRCSFSKLPELPKDVYVVNNFALNTLINNVLSNTEHLISYRDVDSLQAALFQYSQVSDDVKAKHIEDVNKMLNEHKEIKNTQNQSKEYSLRDVLLQFRKFKSSKLNVTENYIFSNEELDKLVDFKPLTVEELKQNSILPLAKLYSHGNEIVDLINDYSYASNFERRQI